MKFSESLHKLWLPVPAHNLSKPPKTIGRNVKQILFCYAPIYKKSVLIGDEFKCGFYF